MAVGCKIIRDFPRPARELVERFRGVATSNLVDVMGSCAAIDGALAPIGRGKLLGTAFPVRLPQGDNLMLHAAIDLAQPGDVLVIDAGGFSERAVLGELMASYCKTRGIRGIVCDGAKASCAAKIATAVEAGIMGYDMYMCGQEFHAGDGLVGAGVEANIQNVGRLAKDGMKETNQEIIKIMIGC